MQDPQYVPVVRHAWLQTSTTPSACEVFAVDETGQRTPLEVCSMTLDHLAAI